MTRTPAREGADTAIQTDASAPKPVASDLAGTEAPSKAPVRFAITADVDPQALSRVINYFAQRGEIPRRVRARLAGETLRITIDHADLDDHQASIVAEKMRSSVLVRHVQIMRGQRRLQP